MATLLPPGVQQFSDQNGAPYAGGSVLFTIPNTDTLKPTYQDPLGAILNTNPVILDAAGRAVIYGTGSYRERLYDADGNLIWDQLTASTASGTVAWGGESTGTVNAQVVDASSFAEEDGQLVGFIAGLTNTSALTIAPGVGSSPIAVLKDTLNGPVPCTGGEVTNGNAVLMIYEQSRGAFHLVEIPNPPGITGALTDIAGASTIDLGSVASQNANVTGSGWTATSFGSSANVNQPIYYLTFASTGTLTHNATSLILPGGANIPVSGGDTAGAMYLGSGNWRVIWYTKAVPNYRFIGTQRFTATGTYTPSAGCVYIEAVGIGGGGAGGGVSTGAAQVFAGGGGGGGATSVYQGAAPSPTAAVTIGTGAGTASGTGGAGGDTILGSLLTAKGGAGGVGGAAPANNNARLGGAGGSSASGVGTIKYSGPAGANGLGFDVGGNNYVASGGVGGGRAGGRGAAVQAIATGGSLDGSAAGNYGSGGGGGACCDTGSSANGGAGSIGFLYVNEYAYA